MTVVVAVTESAEGRRALEVAVEEAQLRQSSLVVVDLTDSGVDVGALPSDVHATAVSKHESLAIDELVIKTIEDHADARLLVVGLKKRTPVGKAVLGSLTQRLLLDSPIAVLSVKAS